MAAIERLVLLLSEGEDNDMLLRVNRARGNLSWIKVYLQVSNVLSGFVCVCVCSLFFLSLPAWSPPSRDLILAALAPQSKLLLLTQLLIRPRFLGALPPLFARLHHRLERNMQLADIGLGNLTAHTNT